MYIIFIIDKFSKYLWGIPLKNKYAQTLTNVSSNILTTSKQSLVKIESKRRALFYNNIFQTS